MSQTILIADGDLQHRQLLEKELCKGRPACVIVDSAATALNKLRRGNFDVAVLDLNLPDMDGIELFKILTQVSPNTSVIVFTHSASLRSTIAALRLGAVDYMIKPLNIDTLKVKIKRILENKKFIEKAQFIRQQLDDACEFCNITVKSTAMKHVCALIQRVAKTDSNVLITGKSGTGKELVARAIHCNSLRKNRPYITVNCGAILESLFESELFGHQKGAFTHAIKTKQGLFKLASRGTLVFDEIACFSLKQQAKLLRAIEFNRITPIGATEPIEVDIRYIASSNHNLAELVESNTFREDLFYRLSVFEINVPSIEERKEDIPLLVQHFINKFAKEMNKPIKGINQNALEILVNSHWRGEVRELENAVERAMIFCDNEIITEKEIPSYLSRKSNDMFVIDYNKPLKDAVLEFEKHYILKNLKSYGGHRAKTYKSIGLSESSFYRKIEELKLKEMLQGYKERNEDENETA